MNNRSKTMLIITLTTLLCKVFGFVKNSFLAYYYGTSIVVDAYVMTFAIGTITSGWIAGLIGNLTPVYKKVETEKSSKDATRFAANLLNWLIIIIIILSVILEIFAPQIVKMVSPGFKGEKYQLTVQYFRFYILSLIFYATYRFFQEFLNCIGKHEKAIIPDLLMSTCCIVSIVVSTVIGAEFLIYGYVIAILLEAVLELVFSYKSDFRFYRGHILDENLKLVFAMAVPIFLSDTIAQINTLVDKMFASFLPSGAVSVLDYANTLKDCAYQIGTIAILITIFPVISKYWADGKLDEFSERVIKGINYMTVIFLPLIFAIFILSSDVISIVFSRGEFNEIAAQMTSLSFILYSCGLLALSYRCIFFKAFYAMQKTKIVLLISFTNVTLNILMNAVFVKLFGYAGLALSTSIASSLCLPLYFWFFKKNTNAKYVEVIKTFFRTLVTSVAMAGAVFLIKVVIERLNILVGKAESILVIGVSILVGVVIYVFVGKWLHINEIDELLNIIRKRK